MPFRFFLSCKAKHNPGETLVYDNNLEVLYSKVKQVTEITKEPHNLETFIIDFDLHSNITCVIRKELCITEVDTTELCNDSLKWEYKYDKNGNLTDAIVKRGLFPQVIKYDKNGRVAQRSSESKELRENSDHILKQDKFYYKYDGDGYLIKCDYYYDTEHKFSKKYKYNDRHLLIEEDMFSRWQESKTIYKYQAIDEKGNWLTRTGSINIDNKSFETDTNTRKITYY